MPFLHRIEELTAQALRADFSRELSAGRLVWTSVNIDEPRNSRYRSEYSIQSRSVVVSRKAGGRRVEWKNLGEVWSHLGNETAFRNYISREVRAYLLK